MTPMNEPKPQPINPDPKTHPIHPTVPTQPIHEPLEGTDPKRPVTPGDK